MRESIDQDLDWRRTWKKKNTQSNNKLGQRIKRVKVKILTKQEKEEGWKCIICCEFKDACVVVIWIVV